MLVELIFDAAFRGKQWNFEGNLKSGDCQGLWAPTFRDFYGVCAHATHLHSLGTAGALESFSNDPSKDINLLFPPLFLHWFHITLFS